MTVQLPSAGVYSIRVVTVGRTREATAQGQLAHGELRRNIVAYPLFYLEAYGLASWLPGPTVRVLLVTERCPLRSTQHSPARTQCCGTSSGMRCGRRSAACMLCVQEAPAAIEWAHALRADMRRWVEPPVEWLIL